MMHGPKKSETGIVVMKAANKAMTQPLRSCCSQGW